MDGTLPKISFLKLQGKGGGAPIAPRGWMGVDGMDLDHNIPYARHYKPRLVYFFTPFSKTIYVL